jgi:hypothetical protein
MTAENPDGKNSAPPRFVIAVSDVKKIAAGVAYPTALIREVIQNLSQAQDGPELISKGRFAMYALSKIATCATLGALVALVVFGLPARADEPIQNLGPVGPHAPIMTTVGSKGVIAFYEPDGNHCGLYAVVYSLADESGASAAQVRINLNARQVVNIDSPDNHSLSLRCGDYAETLSIVDSNTEVAEWPQR